MTLRPQVRRILCPTDFSDFGTRALQMATALGRWLGSEVTLLHVVPPARPLGEGVAYVPGPLSPSPFRASAEDELARVVAPFLHEPVAVKTRLREGAAWREIEAEARELPADLIVMGTHGRSGFEHLLLGSVTEKVLRVSPCPILAVGRGPAPPPWKRPFSRILCATDLTAESAATLSFALSLAEEGEARIVLLHVLDGRFDPRAPGKAPEEEATAREVEAFARERLRLSVPDEARAFCSVEERVVVGKPSREILRAAAHEAADLVVMGAHAQGPLSRLLLGSTASQVVREATCPVLVVRTSERPAAAGAEDVTRRGELTGPLAGEEAGRRS